MVTFPGEENNRLSDSTLSDSSASPFDSEDDQGTTVILGKGEAKSLIFQWSNGEWSICSQSCGAGGFQIRSIKCTVRLHNSTQDVESSLCEDAGIKSPQTIKKCGESECPKWVVSEWPSCDSSKCYTWNTGKERGTIVRNG